MLDFSVKSFSESFISGFNTILPKLPGAIMALLVGYILIKIVGWVAEALLSLVRMHRGLRNILGSLISAVLWIFLAIVVLQSLGLGSLAIIFSGSLAAVGLALASGGSSLAADILGGIFLAQDKDFNVGDEVIAGDKQTKGVIKSMDMRRTRIETPDGKLHILPNSIIERNEWTLLSKKSDRK